MRLFEEPWPDESPSDPLGFRGGGAFPVQYEVYWAGDHYYIRYRSGTLTIERNDELVHESELSPDHVMDGEWDAEETRVYLTLIRRAIRRDAFDELVLPRKDLAEPVRLPPRFGRLPEIVTKTLVALVLLGLLGWMVVMVAERQRMARSYGSLPVPHDEGAAGTAGARAPDALRDGPPRHPRGYAPVVGP